MQVWFPDDLHMFGRGLLECGLKAIIAALPEDALTDITEQLDVRWTAQCRPSTLPYGGLDAIFNRVTASQIVALSRCAVVPMAVHAARQARAITGAVGRGTDLALNCYFHGAQQVKLWWAQALRCLSCMVAAQHDEHNLYGASSLRSKRSLCTRLLFQSLCTNMKMLACVYLSGRGDERAGKLSRLELALQHFWRSWPS